MGHYIDVAFSASLNEFGIELVQDLYRTRSWADTVALYPTSHPSIFAGITDECNAIPFSAHSSLRDIPSSGNEDGTWWIHIMYKWTVTPEVIIHNLLQYLIAEPCTVSQCHDLWEKKKLTIVQPKDLPGT